MEVRELLENVLAHGVKASYISEQTNISASYLCKFRKNNLNLSSKKEKVLKEFLKRYSKLIKI